MLLSQPLAPSTRPHLCWPSYWSNSWQRLSALSRATGSFTIACWGAWSRQTTGTPRWRTPVRWALWQGLYFKHSLTCNFITWRHLLATAQPCLLASYQLVENVQTCPPSPPPPPLCFFPSAFSFWGNPISVMRNRKQASFRSELRAEQDDSRLDSDVFFFFLSIQLIRKHRRTVRGLDEWGAAVKRQCELTAASKQETLNVVVFYEEDIFY